MKLITTFLFCVIASAPSFALTSWIQRATFPANARHRGVGISIGSRGYIGFGHYNGAGPNIVMKDWWEFDPSTNSWTQKADYNGNGANGTYAALAFGMETVGFVGGGQVASNSSFHKYDPSTNTWTPVANCPTIPMNTQGFVIGNKGYYLSGNNVYEYDATLNLWTSKNMAPFSIGIWPSTFTMDNKGYVKSGSSLWEYKPTLDLWVPRAAFPGLASAGSVSFSQSNKGYVVSGYSGWLANVLSEVWEYDPGIDQWVQLTEFPGTSRRFACGFQVGNRCYLGIGTNGTNFTDLWEFDKFLELDEMFDASQFTCYPNPATDYVNFHSANLNDYSVIIYSAQGKRIAALQSNNKMVQLNRNNLENGIYFYTIEVDGKIVYSSKFIFN